MQRSNSFVLDSYALIGYLENEPFSDRIEEILIRAKKGVCKLYLHAIHLGEVYYITHREQGIDIADVAYSRIKAFPIKLINSIDEELLLMAATFKANHSISYVDAFAAAMSKINRCPILTGDPEFKALEKQGLITIEWLT